MNDKKQSTYRSDYVLLEFKRKCNDFGVIAGKDGTPSEDDLKNQVRLITEEAKELLEAFENEPLINTLQELTDVLVVGFGLLEMFRKLNYDVDGALLAVADCNLSKFTKNGLIAAESASKYTNDGTPVDFSYNSEYDVWVLKDLNDKVRKPLDFKKVNLEEFKPK
jgi:NTP pyrophosphatase (non-canonical NTP hydrolase)